MRVYTDQGIAGPGETTDASQGNVPFIRQFGRMLTREMIPGDERSKARILEIREMGFTAAKIDIDDARDRRVWIA